MVATTFTPLESLAGGALIGLAAVLLMALEGRIAGISGIAARLLPPYDDGRLAGRAAFVLGLMVAPLVMIAATAKPLSITVPTSLPLMAAAGLLVGFGATLGSGCTSGHGVCGLARFSLRSLAAVAVFMATAMVTVFVARHGLGG